MPKGSVGTPTVVERRVSVPRFTLGRRCSRCHRYLFAVHRPRPGAGSEWHHARCEDLPVPSHADFDSLASLLVGKSKKIQAASKEVSELVARLERLSFVARLRQDLPGSTETASDLDADRLEQLRSEVAAQARHLEDAVAELTHDRSDMLLNEWLRDSR